MTARRFGRAEEVRTGQPTMALLACTICGVLLWDIDAHYEHAHSEADDE